MLTDKHMLLQSTPPPAVTRRSATHIPQHIWDTLTDHQKTAIHTAIADRATNHIAAVRSSFRIAGRRYYLALLFGHERRSVERLRREGQLDPEEVSIIFMILGTLTLVYGFMLLILVVYMIKSLLGIDIMDGPSPLHVFICR